MGPCRDEYQTISHYLERRPWRGERSSVIPIQRNATQGTPQKFRLLRVRSGQRPANRWQPCQRQCFASKATTPRMFGRFAQIIITLMQCNGFEKAVPVKCQRKRNYQTSASGRFRQPSTCDCSHLHDTDTRGICAIVTACMVLDIHGMETKFWF